MRVTATTHAADRNPKQEKQRRKVSREPIPLHDAVKLLIFGDSLL